MTKQNNIATATYVSELRKPVTWRWDRACALVEQHKKSGVRFYDDEYTSQAVKYLIKKRNAVDSVALAEEFPAVYEADMINTEASMDRWTIEALVLANETVEKISAYTCASVELVTAYEKLFFDVRSRLKAPGFIHMRVFNNYMQNVESNDPDGMWKIVGYNGGPDALYALWSCRLPDSKVIDWFKGMRKWTFLQTAARAAKSIVPNKYNSVDLVAGSFKLDELELAAQNAINPADTTTSVLLTQLNYTLANITPEAASHNQKELRASEKLQLELEKAGLLAPEMIDVSAKSLPVEGQNET